MRESFVLLVVVKWKSIIIVEFCVIVISKKEWVALAVLENQASNQSQEIAITITTTIIIVTITIIVSNARIIIKHNPIQVLTQFRIFF